MAVQRTKPLPAQPRPAAEEGLRARILMVDDHPPNLLALDAILSPLGEELVGVTSGEDALRQLLDGEFALILMDVQMPGMDGIETAAVIKQRERNRSTPIIFLTAIAKDPSFIFKGYSQGAVDYLLKPFDPEILRTKVSVFVDLWRGRPRRSRARARAAAAAPRRRAALAPLPGRPGARRAWGGGGLDRHGHRHRPPEARRGGPRGVAAARAGGARAARGGEPLEGRVPRHRLARAADAAQRHPRLDPHAPHRRAGGR